MKLNYTSLQHPVDPVEAGQSADDAMRRLARGMGEKARHARSWSCRCTGTWRRRRGRWRRPRQELAGRLRADRGRGAARVAQPRRRRAARARPARGPHHRGARLRRRARGDLEHGRRARRRRGASAGTSPWSARVPGSSARTPSSATAGMAALDSAHAALVAGAADDALAAPLLGRPARAPRRPQPPHLHGARAAAGPGRGRGARRARTGDRRRPGRGARRRTCSCSAAADLDDYAAAGLPARTMGRSLDEDPLFFAAPLAAGAALAGAALRRKG